MDIKHNFINSKEINVTILNENHKQVNSFRKYPNAMQLPSLWMSICETHLRGVTQIKFYYCA